MQKAEQFLWNLRMCPHLLYERDCAFSRGLRMGMFWIYEWERSAQGAGFSVMDENSARKSWRASVDPRGRLAARGCGWEPPGAMVGNFENFAEARIWG